jgi:hypothetical protein
MTHYILKRILLALPALWLVLTLVLLIHIVPGDPVEQMLGEGAAPGQVAQLRYAPGLRVLEPAPRGAMLNEPRGHLFDAPHTVVFSRGRRHDRRALVQLLENASPDWLDPSTRAQLEVAHLPR